MWRYSDDLAFLETEDGVYCLNTRDTLCAVVRLDGPGAVIWNLLPDRTTDEIVDVLNELLSVDPEQVRHTVEAFLASLRERGMVQSVEA
jgi:hypothetical protein